jgi:putative ABC transport system ATP-binding protein
MSSRQILLQHHIYWTIVMIDLNNVTAGYGARTVLNQLNLSVKQGEFIHILGENGAGKSTLFNVLLSKLTCKSGTIHLNNTLIQSLSLKQRAHHIAYVSQNTLQGTVAEFTVLENLEMALLRGNSAPLRIRQRNIDQIQQQLSLCDLGLEDRLNTIAGNLSGGQRQALSLIMALQSTPKILLLDEHTSALDPNTANRIMALTHHIVAANNITCLMITHHLHDALQYGDRIIILDKGTVAKEFTPTQKASLTHHELIDIMLNIGTQSC